MSTRSIKPFGEMLSLHDAMRQLLEGSVVRPGLQLGWGGATAQSFPINVWTTADEVQVEALLPGVRQEDVQVDLDRGVLTIAATRHGAEPAEGQQWYLREIQPGQYSRAFSLPFPVEVDAVAATFANGVLTLTLPKAAAAKPRRIQIGGAQPAQLASGATA
jgi:HSP20 family protein